MRRQMSRFARGSVVAWAYVVIALLLGYLVLRLHWGRHAWIGIAPGQVQVIAFLSAVSSGMLAFTGIIFSLLFVLLQFASLAYSPRLVTFLARKGVLTHASGIFTGTFLYSLMVLRGAGALPGGDTATLAIGIAFLWLLASVFVLIRLIRFFRMLEISAVLNNLGAAGQREIARMNPYSRENGVEPIEHQAERVESLQRREGIRTIHYGGKPKYVLAIHAARLVPWAEKAGALIRLEVAVGDSVSSGAALASIEGTGAALIAEKRVRGAIVLGDDHNLEDGPKHVLRLLVDIAVRALSDAINDPTTAVQALDQIEELLIRLGKTQLDFGRVRDASGTLRVTYATPTWEQYLELGVSEIQQYGAGTLQVERRLAALLHLLATTVPEARRPAVQRLLDNHVAVVRAAFPDTVLRAIAEQVDRQGLGHPIGSAGQPGAA
jgi:uncharacterized membrane protein